MMNSKYYLTIFLFALLGVLLSGYLSYWNLFGPSCQQGPLNWLVSCGGPQRVTIFGLPTCVYGFVMFLTVAVLSLFGFSGGGSVKLSKVLVGLGVAGTLFSGGLTIYEIWILKLTFTALPACVYGFVFYSGVLVTSLLLTRSRPDDN